MKKLTLALSLLFAAAAYGQTGYELKVTFKPFKKQYIYLGHYFGKTYPIIDSAILNDKSEAVFKGPKKLPGGIYLIGYPGKAGFFEILVDKQQHFSVMADTMTIKNGASFVNSPDNVLFTGYQQHMASSGKQIFATQEQLRAAKTKADSARITETLTKMDKDVADYRNNLIAKNPDNILTALLVSMKEPQLTGRLKDPQTKEDSLTSYEFYKSHFWDGVNFWDGRLAYTPFFEDKVDKYFTQLVMPHPDSVIKELDMMIGPSSINEEMNRFLLVKFVNRYLTPKYMWEDAVYVHLYEKYFNQKEFSWLNAAGRKVLDDAYYNRIANIMGNPAPEIQLPDRNGKTKLLYADSAAYTIVVFWDATCSHCKEVLPKLDSFYQAKWKGQGIKVYAVSKQTDGTEKNWTDFIDEKHLNEWTNVYYSKEADKARTDSGIPSYSQLYDIRTFPTLYLLDKDKRIIAKKLAYQQIEEILQVKMKGTAGF